MAAISSQYLRLRQAVKLQETLRAAALQAQREANEIPGDAELQRIADDACEAYLRVGEKIEYLEALIDTGRVRRQRPFDAPTPMQILQRQQIDQCNRAERRRAMRGMPAQLPVTLPGKEQAVYERAQEQERALRERESNRKRRVAPVAPEQVQAQSDERRDKEAYRAARKERRRLKSVMRSRARREALKTTKETPQ